MRPKMATNSKAWRQPNLAMSRDKGPCPPTAPSIPAVMLSPATKAKRFGGNQILASLKQATAAKEAEIAIKGEKEGILRTAREDGGKIVEDLRKQAIEEERRLLREATEKSVAILADGHKKAEEERAYILRESEKDVAKLAILAAEKILRTNGKTA